MLLWFSTACARVQSTACLSTWLPVVVGDLTRWLQDENCENTLLNLFHPQKPASSAKRKQRKTPPARIESQNTLTQDNWVWKCRFLCVPDTCFCYLSESYWPAFLCVTYSSVHIHTPPIHKLKWTAFVAQHIKLLFPWDQKTSFLFYILSGCGSIRQKQPSFQVSCLAMQQLDFQWCDYLKKKKKKGEEDNDQSSLCFWWEKWVFM